MGQEIYQRGSSVKSEEMMRMYMYMYMHLGCQKVVLFVELSLIHRCPDWGIPLTLYIYMSQDLRLQII